MTMPDTRQRLAAHPITGRADLDLLLRARGRDEIARLMRRLRRWHRELKVLAYATTLPRARSGWETPSLALDDGRMSRRRNT